MGTYYFASSDVWLGVTSISNLTADLSHIIFTQTMDIKFQRIINGKTRRERITNTTFVDVHFKIC
jgi:hypothetical protein